MAMPCRNVLFSEEYRDVMRFERNCTFSNSALVEVAVILRVAIVCSKKISSEKGYRKGNGVSDDREVEHFVGCTKTHDLACI